MAWTEPPRTWTTDELVTAAIMNTHVRDQFNATWHLIAKKTADESVTTSTVFQDDDHLVLALAANEVWQFQYMLIVQGSSSGDLKMQWTFPASGSFSAQATVEPSAGGAFSTQLQETTTSPTGSVITNIGGAGATIPRIIVVHGFIINASTAGNLTLQWAQNTSNATATTLKTNSALWGAKLA
jgi:hypothetical protein